MSVKAFVDTNIFVYARDAGAGHKQVKSAKLIAQLWETRNGRVSIQILNEYFVTVTRKLKPGLSETIAWRDMMALRAWEPVSIDWSLLDEGRKYHLEYALSWWDALVIAAAHRSQSDIIYSEDLADGQLYGRVRNVNPFLE
jgi:predicted nucleic acid-binding protein